MRQQSGRSGGELMDRVRICRMALLVAGLGAAVSGCDLALLPLPGGFEVLVENRSGQPRVIEVVVDASPGEENRYYLSSPDSQVVVDTIGEANFPTPSVTVLDATCDELFVLRRDFSEGATIVLNAQGSADVELGRSLDPAHDQYDPVSGSSTCEGALE